jgi:hypothetical protein
MKLSVSVTNYSWPDRVHERLASVAGFLDDTAVDTLWVRCGRGGSAGWLGAYARVNLYPVQVIA